MTRPTPDERVLPDQPEFRPIERFWPYAELSEQPDEEELAQLHPELRSVLFGAPVLPFSISLAFPAFEGEAYARAVERARASDEYTDFEVAGVLTHRARFYPGARAADLRDLYELVAAVPGSEVLVDDRAVPDARELWLPLVWFLIR
ncbi:MAG: hypothetical protein IT183_01785 [Acidobacteria bacterium]|nr:hypothetical protein [Acidobacteriota bacterium]